MYKNFHSLHGIFIIKIDIGLCFNMKNEVYLSMKKTFLCLFYYIYSIMLRNIIKYLYDNLFFHRLQILTSINKI